MARLKLQAEKSVRTVGELVFALGGIFRKHAAEITAQKSSGKQDDVIHANEKTQSKVETAISDYLFAGNIATQSQANLCELAVGAEYCSADTIVRFHYDRQLAGKNIVNIAVPEIKGALMEALVEQIISDFGQNLEKIEGGESEFRTKDADDFDLDDYAFESLGSIVILSCHG